MQKNIKRVSALMAMSALLLIVSAYGNGAEPTASTSSADAASAGNQTAENENASMTSAAAEAASSADTKDGLTAHG